MLDGKFVFLDEDGIPLKPKIVSEPSNNDGGVVGHVTSEHVNNLEAMNKIEIGTSAKAGTELHGCRAEQVGNGSQKQSSPISFVTLVNLESTKCVAKFHTLDTGHVHFKRMQDMSKDGLIPAFDMDTEKCQTCMLNKITKKLFQNVKRETEVLELIRSDLCDLHATPSLGNKKAVVKLPDPKLKTLGERGIECIFVGYAEHSKAFRFYVIEPNDSVAINSIIESRIVILDEHRFSSVPKPSQRSLVKGTEDSGGSVVSERVTDEIVQQSEPRKSKRHRTPKDFGPEFQLYLVEGIRDEVSDQHSYCFNVEDDPKTFDEAMKSQDVAFWKEAINDGK
ncbi:hypothetical protein Tco_0272644 [Tanacetum coccineum]